VTLPLADLELAMFTALSALLIDVTTGTTAARPFALVGRFAGPLSEDTIMEVCTQYPAALLAYGGEQVTRTVNTIGGDAEDRSLARWTVYVAAEDVRAIEDGTIGITTAPGGLRLVDSVLGVLSGLPLDGAWFDRRLRCVGTREALIRRGTVYVYAVDFEASRPLPQVTPTDTSVDLTAVHGDVNLTDTLNGDNPDNPVVQFVADTEA
jgi:phage gp37-like protein